MKTKTLFLIAIPVAMVGLLIAAVVLFFAVGYFVFELPKQRARAMRDAEHQARINDILSKATGGPGTPNGENPRLTKENYLRIQNGMPYDDVVLILGPPFKDKFSSKLREIWCSGGIPNKDGFGWFEEPKIKIEVHFSITGERFTVSGKSHVGLN